MCACVTFALCSMRPVCPNSMLYSMSVRGGGVAVDIVEVNVHETYGKGGAVDIVEAVVLLGRLREQMHVIVVSSVCLGGEAG